MRRVAVFSTALVVAATLSASPSWAGCIDPEASPEAINAFKSNPNSLASPQADPRGVEATTRELAATDANLVNDLIAVAKNARPQIQTSIAAGLAQAAVACTNVNPNAAQTIQEAVANFDNGQFQASFAAVAGDLSTAATAAAAGAAAAGAGSVAIINPTSSTNSGNTPRSSGTTNTFRPTVFNVTAASTFSDVGTTSVNPVSPVQ